MQYLFPLIFGLLLMSPLQQLRAENEPPGQIAVSPSLIELEIGERPATRSIRLKNLKERPVTLKVDVYNWTLDARNQVKLLPADAQSLDGWMVVNPLQFTMEPGTEQVIRIGVRPPVKPSPGEHRAIIYFNEQPSPEARNIEILFRLGVGVYAYADPVQKAGLLQSLQFDRSRGLLKADLQNNGNVHTRFTGDYAIWKRGSFPGFSAMKQVLAAQRGQGDTAGVVASGKLNKTPVLPGKRTLITTRIPVPEETSGYELAILGSIDGKRIEKLFPF